MRGVVSIPIVLAAAALAGCISGLPSGGPEALASAPVFLPPVPVSTEWPGAEPVVAVASDGTIYVEGIGRVEGPPAQNVNKAWRSDDGGATWIDITPPAVGQDRSNDGFVAVGNGDRVYVANVFQFTFQLFRSDDKGATWTPLQPIRAPALMHRHWIVPAGERTVHVAIEALPPEDLPGLLGAPARGPDSLNEGLWYVRSDDLGATWTTPVQIDPIVNFAGQGNLVADVEGAALFVPRYEEAEGPPLDYSYERGHWYLLASEDGGASWERREMFDLTAELSTAVPSLAVDPAGTLYFAWSETDRGRSVVKYATSKDRGASWSAPVAPLPGSSTHAMAWVAARAEGEIGLMWYAADANGTALEVDAPWFVEYALVQEADGDAPRVAVARVTPEPVHHGNVCAKGPACNEGEDRSLLDYPWLAFGPDGAAHVVFASTEWDRPSAFAVFAREDVGPAAG